MTDLQLCVQNPKLVLGRSDTKSQEEFIENYKKLRLTKGVNNSAYFLGGTHPQTTVLSSMVGSKKGKSKNLRVAQDGKDSILMLSLILKD
jgi:hypothetical protein